MDRREFTWRMAVLSLLAALAKRIRHIKIGQVEADLEPPGAPLLPPRIIEVSGPGVAHSWGVANATVQRAQAI